jgi:hypothetical protein
MGMGERTVPKPEIAAGCASKVPIRSWPFDIIIGFAKRFRKTAVSQKSMGNTYTSMGYLTGRRVTFNTEIKAELTDRNPRTN